MCKQMLVCNRDHHGDSTTAHFHVHFAHRSRGARSCFNEHSRICELMGMLTIWSPVELANSLAGGSETGSTN